MDAWIDRLAAALGEDPLTDAETTRLLGSARDVAHRVERRITPLAAFLLGTATGRRLAGGASRDDAWPRRSRPSRGSCRTSRPRARTGSTG